MTIRGLLNADDITAGVLNVDRIEAGTIVVPKLNVASKVADCVVATSGGDYTSLEDAVEAGERTIFIKSGTYNIARDILLLNGTTIFGENKEETILDFDSKDYSIRIEPPEEFIYAVCLDYELRKIDKDNNLIWTYSHSPAYITSVAVDKNRYTYSGNSAGEIHKLDRHKNLIWKYTGFDNWVMNIAVDADGYVYGANEYKEIHKIDPDGNLVWKYDGFLYDVWAIAVDANGYVYGGGTNNEIHKIDPDGNLVWKYTEHTDFITGIAVDANGYVYSSSWDNEIHKISSAGVNVWKYTDHTSSIEDVAVDADGYVYSAGGDNEVHKISPAGVNVWKYTDHANWIYSVAVDADGYVYSSSYYLENEIHKISSAGVNVWKYTDLAAPASKIRVLSYPNYDSEIEEGLRTDVAIKNLSIINAEKKAVRGNYIDYAWIEDCIFQNNGINDIYFSSLDIEINTHVERVFILRNVFKNTLDGTNTAKAGTAIEIGTGDGGSKRTIEIRNNHFIDTFRRAILITDWDWEFYSHIEDNSIIYSYYQSVRTPAILAGEGTIEGNYIEGAATGISNYGGIMTSNVIRKCRDIAIEAYIIRNGIIISNNQIIRDLPGISGDLSGNNNYAIWVQKDVSEIGNAIISGNHIKGDDDSGVLTFTKGIYMGSTDSVNRGPDNSIVSNNIIGNIVTGIFLEAGADKSTIEANNIFTVTTPITDNGANNEIANNFGYNPVGVSSISVTASVFTYTAGASPETVYVHGGTVSNISKGGTTIFTNTDHSIELKPHESIGVTYSSTPTMIKDIH